MFKILALSLALHALPFPAPKVATVTDDTKFATGSIASVDTARSELKVTTPAGVVTFKLNAAALLVGANGQATSLAMLHQGQTVNVYYVVQNGAIVSELDVQS